ncbi:hypothetical protein [Rurimicrobium arvi]|uniref:Uncharacterized protein n=1 Tax=Rurimicrobium arvi TaxID=2049916 RepID=A0ABP8MVJ5_9BACT
MMDENEKMEKMHQIDISGLVGTALEAKIFRELEDIRMRLARLEQELEKLKKERK